MAAPMLTLDMTEEAAGRAASLIPFSCSTNLANEVNDHLRRAKLTARAWEVCSYLLRQTFGNAGWHRKLGRQEWWCAFDLARWAAALGCDRSNLRRTLAELISCQIICFEPDPAHPGEGHIGWNLAFGAWRPYDRRRQHQARAGQAGVVRLPCRQTQQAGARSRAGSEQASVVSIPLQHAQKTEDAGEEGREQASVVKMAPCGASHTERREEEGQKQARVVNLPTLFADAGEAAHDLTMPACRDAGGNLTTSACSEGLLHQDSILLERKGKRKKKTETPPVVSETLRASPDVERGALRYLLEANAQASNQAQAPTSAAEPPGTWPPRQAWEQTDLDYFQRVLRDNEKGRVALLTRLTHERIGVPLETASYARIGALAKRCGAALLVKHILLAAASHIDGNPLDYLTKLVHISGAGQTRKKETSYGTARTTTSGSSTNDGSRHSGWEGWDVATAR